jgi:hypothetical protein
MTKAVVGLQRVQDTARTRHIIILVGPSSHLHAEIAPREAPTTKQYVRRHQSSPGLKQVVVGRQLSFAVTHALLGHVELLDGNLPTPP